MSQKSSYERIGKPTYTNKRFDGLEKSFTLLQLCASNRLRVYVRQEFSVLLSSLPNCERISKQKKNFSLSANAHR